MIKYWHKFRYWQYKYALSISGISQGIRNLIIWFPVIWKDRWWDHYFLYTILRFKLSFMEKNFRLRGMSVNSEKDAHNIKKCVLLLDRLINDDYINYNKEDNVRKSFIEEQAMIEQDVELLFKIIRKQIRAWWD